MTRTPTRDIVVVGGAYTDYVVQGSHLPVQGEMVVGNEFLRVSGGKGSNQAVAAARLGAHVALVTRVGNDAQGDEIVAQLNDEHVDTRYVMRDSTHQSGMSLIQVNEQGRKQMMVALGACQLLSLEDVQQAAEAIQTARFVMTQLEIPLTVAVEAIRLAKQSRAQVFFDPSPPVALPDELLPMVDIIKPDTKEAQAITEIAVHDRDTARVAAKQLLRRGVRIVAVQAGNEGDLLVWRDGERWLPRIPLKSVDSTGAGDAFAAALTLALIEGHSLEEAGSFASATAALTTTKLGARPALPTRQEVAALLLRINGKTL